MTSSFPRIFLQHLGDDYDAVLREGFEWIDLKSKLKPNGTVFIKPNLTFPVFRKGVMTNPACVEAIVRVLKDYTSNIVVGEADSGGYNRFDINAVLEKTGIRALEKKYGIRVVNLSHLPRRDLEFDYKGRDYKVPFPVLLLDETDLFITVPVPKIHMNTGVSMSIKNQWGCIPEPSIRLKLHPVLEEGFVRDQQAAPQHAVGDRWQVRPESQRSNARRRRGTELAHGSGRSLCCGLRLLSTDADQSPGHLLSALYRERGAAPMERGFLF